MLMIFKSIAIRSSWFLLQRIAVALLTCTCAAAGAVVGSIAGALRGHTAGTGLSCGLGLGATAGAITAVQLMDLVISDRNPLSMVALILCSLVNEEIYKERVRPAMLKPYQWQESSFDEIPDIFEDTNTTRSGLSDEAIKELPVYEFHEASDQRSTAYELDSCAICLQDLKEGEAVRLLSNCMHLLHADCIDRWLSKQGSCPICRNNV